MVTNIVKIVVPEGVTVEQFKSTILSSKNSLAVENAKRIIDEILKT